MLKRIKFRIMAFLVRLRYRNLIVRSVSPSGEKTVSVIMTDWLGREKEAAHFTVARETDRFGNEIEFISGAYRH